MNSFILKITIASFLLHSGTAFAGNKLLEKLCSIQYGKGECTGERFCEILQKAKLGGPNFLSNVTASLRCCNKAMGPSGAVGLRAGKAQDWLSEKLDGVNSEDFNNIDSAGTQIFKSKEGKLDFDAEAFNKAPDGTFAFIKPGSKCAKPFPEEDEKRSPKNGRLLIKCGDKMIWSKNNFKETSKIDSVFISKNKRNYLEALDANYLKENASCFSGSLGFPEIKQLSEGTEHLKPASAGGSRTEPAKR